MRSRRGMTAIVLAAALLTLAGVSLAALAVWRGLPGLPTTQPVAHATATPTLPAATPTVWSDPRTRLLTEYTPYRLEIPSIHLDVFIIGVGVTSAGAMDAPRCNENSDPICNEVYWFDGGFLPGEQGNAVIAGHVNRPDLSPAPFWNLHLVRVGDKIIVQPLHGPALTFIVTSTTWISAYAHGSGNSELGEVFGPATTRNLNLLTCIGDWDGHTFDHRLFVQAKLSGPNPFPTS